MRGDHSTAQHRAEQRETPQLPLTRSCWHSSALHNTTHTVYLSNVDCRSPWEREEVMPSCPLHRLNHREDKHSCCLPPSTQWRHWDQRIGYSDNMVPDNTTYRANTCVWMKHLTSPPVEPGHHHSRNNAASVCISYRRRHFALSGHPLLYSCRVRFSPLYFIQMLSLHSPTLVAWLHVRSQRQPIASFLLRIDADTGRGDPHLLLPVSAGIREGNSPPPPIHWALTPPRVPLLPHSLTHSHWHLHKRWRLAERF